MSPELMILDDLLGGDIPLEQARAFFDRDQNFMHAMMFMLEAREIRLLDSHRVEVPRYRWLESLSDALTLPYFLTITDKGSARIS